MKEQSFTGVVQAGHKEHAVEGPFNPAELWGRGPERFAPGRRGVVVRGRIHGVEFMVTTALTLPGYKVAGLTEVPCSGTAVNVELKGRA